MKTQKTFRDYLEETGNKLITTPYSDRPYMKEYQEEYEEYMFTIDIEAKEKFGGLIMLSNDWNVVNDLVRATCVKCDYKWRKLWDTLNLEYDPIANVDGTETTTTVYGTHETESDNGERIQTSNMGERSQTNSIGKRTGASSEDGYTYPYEATDKEKHTAHNSFSNSTEKATDTITNNAYKDTVTNNAYKDKTLSKEHTDTVTHVRKGNIGITSSQNLILQERNVSLFYFWDVVVEDIVNAITIPLWKEEKYCGSIFVC